MALPSQFSLLHSELNDFLFAQIGEEASGAPLSVLSALTRLGTDPWAEGARLSDLPRDAAARSLVPTDGLLVVTGSLYVVADARGVLAEGPPGAERAGPGPPGGW